MKLIRYKTGCGSGVTSDLQEDVDRLLGAAFPSYNRHVPSFLRDRTSPAVDVYDSKNAILVRAEVPGFRKEDITLEIDRGVLTLAGEQKAEEGKEAELAARFNRAFTLPVEVDPAKVSAEYANGIITVTLPKKEEAKPRRIEVNG